MGKLVGVAAVLAITCGTKGADSAAYGRALYTLTVLFTGVAVLFLVIGLRNPRVIVLSRDGLTIRTRAGAFTLPVDAIEALGVTKVGAVYWLTMWYDAEAVPVLSPELEFFVRNQPPAGNGRIHLEPVGPPIDDKKIESVRALVQQERLGEWRGRPA